ncbi:unnamed protein product, partial [Parnassius apollo]
GMGGMGIGLRENKRRAFRAPNWMRNMIVEANANEKTKLLGEDLQE